MGGGHASGGCGRAAQPCPASLTPGPLSSRIRGSGLDHHRDCTSQRGTDGVLTGRGQAHLLPAPRVVRPTDQSRTRLVWPLDSPPLGS